LQESPFPFLPELWVFLIRPFRTWPIFFGLSAPPFPFSSGKPIPFRNGICLFMEALAHSLGRYSGLLFFFFFSFSNNSSFRLCGVFLEGAATFPLGLLLFFPPTSPSPRWSSFHHNSMVTGIPFLAISPKDFFPFLRKKGLFCDAKTTTFFLSRWRISASPSVPGRLIASQYREVPLAYFRSCLRQNALFSSPWVLSSIPFVWPGKKFL